MGFCAECLCASELVAETLVPAGTVWSYLDDGSDPGTTWRETGFADASWRSGHAQLGYGDGDEATRIGYGTNASNKFVTSYFRAWFQVADPLKFSEVTINLLRDDGAVVYLNGREVFRSNMPTGTVGYRTLASASIGGSEETTWYAKTFSATNLVAGSNLVAVEVHQGSTNSTDVSFDLELLGTRSVVGASVLFPADGAAEVTRADSLRVAIPDPRGTTLAGKFYARKAAPSGPDFSLAVLPDTQYYVSSKNGGSPTTFVAQVDWIVANRAASNIAFVTHVGDIVENGENGGNSAEWLNATNAMHRLEDPETTMLPQGIPYGVAVGNHDFSTGTNGQPTTRFYNQFFGANRFEGRDYYGGHYGTNNNNHFELIGAGGLEFIIIHLEYKTSPDTNVLNWANALLQTHRERRGVVVSHWIINAGEQAGFSGQGQSIYSALKGNPNLFLMLCGHVSPEEGRRVDTYNGWTVWTLMSDYQFRTNGGSGWMRLLHFSPSNNAINVRTYSPTLNVFERDTNSEFALPYDMRTGAPFAPLATFTDITTATNLAVSTAGLEYGAIYDWYFTLTDGVATSSTPVMRFTSAPNAPPAVTVARVLEQSFRGFVPSVTLGIEAEAMDPDGVVAKVEFYEGSTPLGEDAAAPFACTWYHVPIGTYAITAVAEDDGGLRATSAPVTITVSLSGNPGNRTLPAPDNLLAAVESTNQIRLEWMDNSTNENGFAVERSTDGATYREIAVLAANTTTLLDDGLLAGITYTYRVRAFSSQGLSDYCEPAGATMPGAPPPAEVRLSLHHDRTNRQMVVSWSSVPGMRYRVLGRHSVSEPAWTELTADIEATGPITTWSEAITGEVPTRFYAVRTVP